MVPSMNNVTAMNSTGNPFLYGAVNGDVGASTPTKPATILNDAGSDNNNQIQAVSDGPQILQGITQTDLRVFHRIVEVDPEFVKLFNQKVLASQPNEENADPVTGLPFPASLLEEVCQKLQTTEELSACDLWEKPGGKHEEFVRRGGWKTLLLKLFQLLSPLLSDSKSEISAECKQTNAFDAEALLKSIQRYLKSKHTEIDDVYSFKFPKDYHSLPRTVPDFPHEKPSPCMDSHFAKDSSSVDSSFVPTGYVSPVVHKSKQVDESSPDSEVASSEEAPESLSEISSPVSYAISTPPTSGRTSKPLPGAGFKLFVSLACGAWQQSTEDGESILDKCCVISEDQSSALLIIDLDFLAFSLRAHGRYDGYMWAALCVALKNVHKERILPFSLPSFFVNSWDFTESRATHALRVFSDATNGFRVTHGKFEWYVTLLTSGALEAIQDTLTDLSNDIWHAHFNRADERSRKRLEKILVALLGHSDNLVRSQAVVCLNSLYDQHDWQQDYPFLPLLRSVGDKFFIEVVIHDAADPKSNETPKGVFAILNAPSFERSAPFETYSYHSIRWLDVHGVNATTNVGDSKINQYKSRGGFNKKPGLHRWVGIVDFGRFVRAGYYDWRIVRADEQGGSWNTVQATLAELKRSYSSSFSFIEYDRETDADSFMISQRNLWAELSKLTDLTAGNNTEKNRDGDVSLHVRTLPLQGRFIVQAHDINRQQFHEIFVDHHDAEFGTDGSMIERGSFSSVASSLIDFKKQGITSVYMMGALARDNGETLFSRNGEFLHERPDASPFAATCRSTPNQMLGGVGGFLDLKREADRVGIHILVDSLARVSSSRPHRKYWPHILYSLDESGKRKMLYGTDGRAIHFEDTCLLNYREVESWDLLIDDVRFWATRLGVSGVVLDNAHSCPQIMQADIDELSRVDPDGQPHYSALEKLCGEIVLPFTENESGYWASAAADHFWPNPLCIRLCQEIWRECPDFMFVGECRVDSGMEKRPGMLARSGVIPQLQTMNNHISRLFGRRIQDDGSVVDCPKEDVSIVKDWYDRCHADFPEGAVVIQSSCSWTSPMPGLLYGRGAWPAVDLLFFLSDIPSTFMGEQEGHCFRIDIADVFTIHRDENNNKNNSQKMIQDIQIMDDQSKGLLKLASSRKLPTVKSLLNPNSITSPQTESPPIPSFQHKLSKVRSLAKFEQVENIAALEQAHQKTVGPDFGFDLTKIYSHYEHRRALRHQNRIFRSGLLVPLQASKAGNPVDIFKYVLAFCRFDVETGGFALCVINFTSDEIDSASVSLKILGRQFHSMGIDATSVFQSWNLYSAAAAMGGLPPLANSSSSTRTDKLSGDDSDPLFSLADFDISAYLASGEVDSLNLNVITLGELLSEPQQFKLPAFGSCCYGFKILSRRGSGSEQVQRALYSSSLKRLEKLVRSVNAHAVVSAAIPQVLMDTIKSNHIISSLVNALHQDDDLAALACVLAKIDRALQLRNESKTKDALGRERALTLFELLVDSQVFVTQPKEVVKCVFTRRQPGDILAKPDAGTILMAKMRSILQGKPTLPNADATHNAAGVYMKCEEFLEKNNLGPIVMMTTELGKWSTVGGLGVMVDELSTTMALDLGQQVTVVSPYYERDRNGETGYLAKDGINYNCNIKVSVGGQDVILGVHEGVVKGVRLIFLHNVQFFNQPYPDFSPADSLRYLAVIGKGFLEALCQLKEIPQLIVTNDWPTGLVPAYAKQGHFGDAFNGTTFFHICHNFDPSYEGRVYADKRDDLSWIHGLPHDLLVDPLWGTVIFNPSRCALLQCDAWGTVSPSYRDDLRGRNNPSTASPLAPLLNRYRTPFATPNGIPVEARKARLRALNCRGHGDAKGILQKKYFGFQKPDPEIPLFAFIGRITSQKGVHLILDTAEGMIRRYNNRIQILVGGKVNWKDPYSARCAHQMIALREKYPYSFWADPNQFFTDGTLVNLGADIGLMPSAFEPGGIVQHEFFVAGTPVIAFKTGGLKDTVFEFNLEEQSGNGFTFEAYNLGDFLFAMERAHRVFQDPTKYHKLRKNCEESVVSTEECASAWLGEFCRLRRKIKVNNVQARDLCSRLPAWSENLLLRNAIQTSNSDQAEPAKINKLTTAQVSHKFAPLTQKLTAPPEVEKPAHMSLGPSVLMSPAAGKDVVATPLGGPKDSLSGSRGAKFSAIHGDAENRRATRIKYVPTAGLARPRTVALSGSFDDWRVRRPLTFDNSLQAFVLNMALPAGKHYYKLIVDGDWICNQNEPIEKDPTTGIANNFVEVKGS